MDTPYSICIMDKRRKLNSGHFFIKWNVTLITITTLLISLKKDEVVGGGEGVI